MHGKAHKEANGRNGPDYSDVQLAGKYNRYRINSHRGQLAHQQHQGAHFQELLDRAHGLVCGGGNSFRLVFNLDAPGASDDFGSSSRRVGANATFELPLIEL